jgi:hypothetical protein
MSRGGVVGYLVVDNDGRPVLGEFAEATLYTDWLAVAPAARAAGGRPVPVVAAPTANADGPRRGRPKKVEAE